MEERTLKHLLEEMIYKINAICDEVREIRGNTVSKDEYEFLQKQMEALLLQVAKNSNVSKNHLLYLPLRTAIVANASESSRY